MEPEKIQELAMAHQVWPSFMGPRPSSTVFKKHLMEFAEALCKTERERCAAECDNFLGQDGNSSVSNALVAGYIQMMILELK